MDVVQLNFAYNTKKLQFKQSKFLGSYHSPRLETPQELATRRLKPGPLDTRPPGTEYAVKNVFWQKANFKVDCYVGNLKRIYIVIDKKTIL